MTKSLRSNPLEPYSASLMMSSVPSFIEGAAIFQLILIPAPDSVVSHMKDFLTTKVFVAAVYDFPSALQVHAHLLPLTDVFLYFHPYTRVHETRNYHTH